MMYKQNYMVYGKIKNRYLFHEINEEYQNILYTDGLHKILWDRIICIEHLKTTSDSSRNF